MAFKTKADKADKVFALYIKKRDNWTCQRCGKKYSEDSAQGLDCSHYKSRRKENVRFEPLNCDAICTGCHAWFHQNPDQHKQWQVAKKGQHLVELLDLAAFQYKKRDRQAEALYWAEQLKLLDSSAHT